MLSFADLAVTENEALDYVSRSGTAVLLHETDLMRGQRYIAARFNGRWLAEWDNAAAPDHVKYAIIEAALIESRKPGSLSVVSTPSSDKVLVSAGKLQWERVKGPGGEDGFVPRSSVIEGLLSGLARSTASGVTFLARA